jgi:hypothetical protein
VATGAGLVLDDNRLPQARMVGEKLGPPAA